MNIKSVLMRLNARKYSLISCKSRSYCVGRCLSSAPRPMVPKNSGHLIERFLPNALQSIGIASNRRCTKLESRSNFQLRLYSSEADAQNAGSEKVIKTIEMSRKEQQKSIKDLAEGEYEKALVSAVISPDEIGVKFDDVGALEHVKKTLYETVILPLKRPELFSHGNLLKSCKGVLLFGPPGTGKTLMAKALATESGAHFINVTAATISSKWCGETENLTRALFTYARKLAPVIIFIDEAESLLGARGDGRYRDDRLNEFMAAWDGLITNDSQRILVMGATNRPFDLDDAVLRRMPRRVYVGLPDAENRSKILNILLSKENLEPDFCIDKLAKATQGYSGDDLKNLCVAAAYRPVQDLLEQEAKGDKFDGPATLRQLNLDDFILSKSKVRPSLSPTSSIIQKLKEWDKKYGEQESVKHPKKRMKK